MAEYLSDSYLAAIKGRAAGGEGPWAGAVELLRVRADAALEQAPVSVRENGGSPFFRQDAVYVEGKDGVIDKASNRKSGELAKLVSNSTLDLALGYRFFDGDDRYAEKALELIHTWCINNNTLMFPTGGVFDSHTAGGRHAGDIIIFGSMNNLFLACYLLRGYAKWGLRAQAAVKRWIKAMVDPQRELMFFAGREMYNNWEDARLMYLAKGALALDDLDLLCQVFDRWCMTIPLKMTDEGELHRETMRTKSMHYTLFALDSMMQVAEIGRQLGVDLYDYEVNGRRLKMAVDYAARYLLDVESWPHQMIEPVETLKSDASRFRCFEMAYSYWGDTRYLEVLERYFERPLPQGYGTLLFGRR